MEKETNPIVIRPAGPRDAELLGDLHFTCSGAQPGAFMHRLGRGFFVAYYRLLLREPTTVILVADAGADGLVGLVSATLDSRRQLDAIRSGRSRLLLAALPALIRSPRLVWEVLVRERSTSARAGGDKYIVSSGPRIAYWGWLPGYPAHGRSTSLIKEVLLRLEMLGASRVSLEIDRFNRKVEVMNRFLGARVVKVLTTPDGRERIILEYVLGPKAEQHAT
jgi:hypothetical protein